MPKFTIIRKASDRAIGVKISRQGLCIFDKINAVFILIGFGSGKG